MAQNDYGRLEHGSLQWLPPNHARISGDDYKQKEQFGLGMQQARPHGLKTPPATESNPPLQFENQSRSRQRPQRRRNQWNWAGGGPGMQAIFLGSNQKSCGTGVFLPRRNGNDSDQFNNKPGLSPVLLPSRVVQALKLNVHELGQQIKPQPDRPEYVSKKIDKKLEKNNADEVCLSPEIFLPEEWTY